MFRVNLARGNYDLMPLGTSVLRVLRADVSRSVFEGWGRGENSYVKT